MLSVKDIIEFKETKISKKELEEKAEKSLNSIFLKNAVIVDKNSLINILVKYKNKEISKQFLLDWVNVIWFTDLFEYKSNQENAIASVMSRLEDLDERNVDISKEELDKFIISLSKNMEI